MELITRPPEAEGAKTSGCLLTDTSVLIQYMNYINIDVQYHQSIKASMSINISISVSFYNPINI